MQALNLARLYSGEPFDSSVIPAPKDSTVTVRCETHFPAQNDEIGCTRQEIRWLVSGIRRMSRVHGLFGKLYVNDLGFSVLIVFVHSLCDSRTCDEARKFGKCIGISGEIFLIHFEFCITNIFLGLFICCLFPRVYIILARVMAVVCIRSCCSLIPPSWWWIGMYYILTQVQYNC